MLLQITLILPVAPFFHGHYIREDNSAKVLKLRWGKLIKWILYGRVILLLLRRRRHSDSENGLYDRFYGCSSYSRQIITFHEVKELDSAVDMVYGSTMFVVIMMADLLPPKSICGCMTEDEGFS